MKKYFQWKNTLKNKQKAFKPVDYPPHIGKRQSPLILLRKKLTIMHHSCLSLHSIVLSLPSKYTLSHYSNTCTILANPKSSLPFTCIAPTTQTITYIHTSVAREISEHWKLFSMDWNQGATIKVLRLKQPHLDQDYSDVPILGPLVSPQGPINEQGFQGFVGSLCPSSQCDHNEQISFLVLSIGLVG